MGLAAFCPCCGGPVETLARSAGRCRRCGREVFANSKPAAGVLIECDGRILLVRRGAEPGRGRWDVPGGYLEEGEPPEEGLRRELREELGIDLGPVRLVDTELNPVADGTVLDLLYEAGSFRGTPRPDSDVADLGWFAPDALPGELAFAATARILERWRARRGPEVLRLLGGRVIEPRKAEPAFRFGSDLARLPAGVDAECGEWGIHDGAVCGRIDGERPAALWFAPAIEGDHLLMFRASTAGQADNDINCYWEGSGRILGGQDTACTIAGVGGWWDGLWGIERNPEGGLRSTARRGRLAPGRGYRIAAGRLGASDFLFVDGELVCEVHDPDAPRRRESRVALATWNSHVHFHESALYRLPGGE